MTRWVVGAGLTCLAVEGWFLPGDDVVAMREKAWRRRGRGSGRPDRA